MANLVKMTPVAVTGTLFNLVVILLSVWKAQFALAISCWASLCAIISIARLHFAKSIAEQELSEKPLAKAENRMMLLAVANGALWGCGMAVTSQYMGAREYGLITMLVGGMMGAAVLTYGVVSWAALAYIGTLMIGAAIAFTVSPYASVGGVLLLVSFAFVLVRTVISNEANFVAKVEGDTKLRDSVETVQLLLNDYERQSADWLWTTNAVGQIEGACDRFAQASKRDIQLLNGAQLITLFDAGKESTMLAEHLQGNFAFRDLTLKLSVDGQPHWWTLSASPRAGGGMRGVASDVTAQKRAEAKVSHMAHYDGLTDLANRFLFNETLQHALKRQRKGQTSAVLCLDLDQFKSVNDTLGHPVGDRLLCEVARRIENEVRSGDLVARLGGDEFAILIDRIGSVADVENCAERIITAIEQPFILDGMQVMTSTSIGIAQSGPNCNQADILMKHGDLALYAAKSNGRNRLAHYESGMDEAASERRELEMDLRAALVQDQFELYYQPLVNVESGQTVSYEALIRWNHPKRGVVLPSEFIMIAEETGLIVQIGEWVIRNAAAELAKWPNDLRVSVNVSPAQMRSAYLVSTVINAVAHAGVAPSRLELEITESVLMNDSEVNLAILHKLRDFGVRISLDDFGTGYSSLNYLRAFPFDKIKIDRCFVEEINEREDCQAIVSAVTGLAHSLGMTTTAEGVENVTQLDQLRVHGCTEVQGYYFSKPSRAEQFTDLRVRSEKVKKSSDASVTAMLPPADIKVSAESTERKRVA